MMTSVLPERVLSSFHQPFALRRVPPACLARLSAFTRPPHVGDLALAEITRIGKNTRLELTEGRLATLAVGNRLAVVFGHRYATEQYEGYATVEGDCCHLLSMGGVCGRVASKHASVAEPTELRILGQFQAERGHPLNLREFGLRPQGGGRPRPWTVAVCGASMDAGKTHTAASLIAGLRRQGCRVGAAKLTGTAAGRDTWSMRDAGAAAVYDFTDCGFPSTYQCTLEELLEIHATLLSHLAQERPDAVVLEIADGLLQQETAALLCCAAFTTTIDAWLYAAGDPLAARGGVGLLRQWGLAPAAVTGKVSMSPLAVREVESAIGLPCLTARQLRDGDLALLLAGTSLQTPPFALLSEPYSALAS